MEINIKNDNINIAPPPPFVTDARNSVAFQLASDSAKESISASSSNRFVVFSSDNKKIAGNNFGMEVSADLKPNMIKTVDDLRAEYSKIDFSMEKPLPGQPEDKDYTEPTTNMLHALNEWLRDKPGVEKYVKKFEFNQYGSGIPGKAFDEFKIIKLGEENFDAAALAETPIRDIDNGLQVIDHEFIHILDRTVSEQESSMLNTRKEQRMNSPEIAEKAEKRRKELIAMYEKQESEGQISKNMADSLRRGIDSLLEMEIYWDNEAQHEILNRKNKEIIISLVDGLYADEQFNKVLDEIMEFNSKKKISVLYVDLLKKDIGDKSPPATQKYDNVRLISRTEAELKLNSIKHNKDTSSEDRRRAAELVAGLNKAIADTTGLYPYSFEGGARNNFLESLSTYSELPPERARKNPGLAQLEYDKAMSADPPEWLRQKAEKRYYGIMGGKDGAYCKANPCGPCLIYKLTCRPAAAAQ